MKWSPADIPDLRGRVAVVTGANSGIGFEAVRVLADKHAHVVMACRNQDKGRKAAESILSATPEANLDLMQLDLSSLASIRSFAETLNAKVDKIDLLINNAGVMAIPWRETTDGFEMQIGVNHLGHFALAGLLLDTVLAASGSRVVNVSSIAHKPARVRFHDLQSEKKYNKWAAYGQSKLANLLFTYELDRRLKSAGKTSMSVACHPGWAATELQAVGPEMSGSAVMKTLSKWGNMALAQDAASGALPTLYAATASLRGGEYIGPDGLFEMRGSPTVVESRPNSHDLEAAQKLWQASEELTGVRYTFA